VWTEYVVSWSGCPGLSSVCYSNAGGLGSWSAVCLPQ